MANCLKFPDEEFPSFPGPKAIGDVSVPAPGRMLHCGVSRHCHRPVGSSGNGRIPFPSPPGLEPVALLVP